MVSMVVVVGRGYPRWKLRTGLRPMSLCYQKLGNDIAILARSSRWAVSSRILRSKIYPYSGP